MSPYVACVRSQPPDPGLYRAGWEWAAAQGEPPVFAFFAGLHRLATRPKTREVS